MEKEEVNGNCEIKVDVQRYFMMVFGITGVKSLDPTAKEYRNKQFIKQKSSQNHFKLVTFNPCTGINTIHTIHQQQAFLVCETTNK